MTKSIAFLVDGDLEKRAIGSICKGVTIRKIGNGDSFPTDVLVRQIMTLVRLLGNRYEHLIVLVDRERRELTAADFSAEISAGMVKSGIGNQSFSVHVKDRVVEDWILADPESLSQYLGKPVDCSERKGKWGLKSLLEESDIRYSEVALGSELLKSLVCSRAARNSQSLKTLVETFPAECWWLSR